jgi:hypothetical protein
MIFLLAVPQPFLPLDGLIGSTNVTGNEHAHWSNPGDSVSPSAPYFAAWRVPGTF